MPHMTKAMQNGTARADGIAVSGRVHSFQSLGTVDGPGVRFVVFLSGCNLRCGCCHNPDTWHLRDGKEYAPCEIIDKAERFREYFGKDGGITVSGGEPLMQAAFVGEIFREAKRRGINTCLDTSGSILSEDVYELLPECDRVLLDIKYTEDSLYLKHVGCPMAKPLEFLAELDKRGIPTVLRQVIIPALNDSEENIKRLADIAKAHKCVEKTELLPFRKICEVKYQSLGIKFPFKDIPEPTHESMKRLNDRLSLQLQP